MGRKDWALRFAALCQIPRTLGPVQAKAAPNRRPRAAIAAITPEEYSLLFQGTPVFPCGNQDVRDGDKQPASRSNALGTLGLALPGEQAAASEEGTLPVAVFLGALGLTYCEFVELWKSGIVTFGSVPSGNRDRATELGDFPICEPCCLDNLSIGFPRSANAETGLLQLAIFARLWRKLREQDCCGYTFDQLRDICEVLQLFTASGVNPEFIRQLAAFQMLRDDFHLQRYLAHDLGHGAERSVPLRSRSPRRRSALDHRIAYRRGRTGEAGRRP